VTGATGLEPATSGVTGRYRLNRYNWLPPGITGQSRHFAPERTGCDRLRPVIARQSLCSTRVVELLPDQATTSSGKVTSSLPSRSGAGVAGKAGHRDHETPANQRDHPETSDRAWTHVPGLVFPPCSLGDCWWRTHVRREHRRPFEGSPISVLGRRGLEGSARHVKDRKPMSPHDWLLAASDPGSDLAVETLSLSRVHRDVS
jgi:hypothetical protein